MRSLLRSHRLHETMGYLRQRSSRMISLLVDIHGLSTTWLWLKTSWLKPRKNRSVMNSFLKPRGTKQHKFISANGGKHPTWHLGKTSTCVTPAVKKQIEPHPLGTQPLGHQPTRLHEWRKQHSATNWYLTETAGNTSGMFQGKKTRVPNSAVICSFSRP